MMAARMSPAPPAPVTVLIIANIQLRWRRRNTVRLRVSLFLVRYLPWEARDLFELFFTNGSSSSITPLTTTFYLLRIWCCTRELFSTSFSTDVATGRLKAEDLIVLVAIASLIYALSCNLCTACSTVSSKAKLCRALTTAQLTTIWITDINTISRPDSADLPAFYKDAWKHPSYLWRYSRSICVLNSSAGQMRCNE